ncbi:MAG TPA: DUF4160 domain-containing protein [Clostridia bacterium]
MIDISNEIPKIIKIKLITLFPVIEYRDTVYRELGITVEVRTKEDCHKYYPHVHVKYQNYSASINIITEEIVGNFPSKYLKRILEYVRENKNFLLEKWKKYHDYKYSI